MRSSATARSIGGVCEGAAEPAACLHRHRWGMGLRYRKHVLGTARGGAGRAGGRRGIPNRGDLHRNGRTGDQYRADSNPGGVPDGPLGGRQARIRPVPALPAQPAADCGPVRRADRRGQRAGAGPGIPDPTTVLVLEKGRTTYEAADAPAWVATWKERFEMTVKGMQPLRRWPAPGEKPVGDTMTKTATSPYDVAEHLRTPEDMAVMHPAPPDPRIDETGIL